MSREAELSVILPTDALATIQPVLERLRRQTMADRLEVVLIVPATVAAGLPPIPQAEFAATKVLALASISPLGAARAAGVRGASAPLVFIGETHSYLHPDAAEKLVTAARNGSWAAVAPGFGNANPKNVFSWAGFLGDYGRWSVSLPAGEIPEVPLYNALYRREVLIALGNELENLLSHGDGLRLALQAAGHRVYFEPAARIDHANLNALSRCLHEHFLAGRLIGAQRSRRWPCWCRFVYVLGSPLIPLVLFWRVLPGVRRTVREQPVPRAAIPLILLFNGARALGEMCSYAIGGSARQAAAMDHYEIRKLDYIVSR